MSQLFLYALYTYCFFTVAMQTPIFGKLHTETEILFSTLKFFLDHADSV